MSKWYSKTSFYLFFNEICISSWFSYLILAVIMMNTVSLSMDRYPIDPEEAATLEMINFVSTWIFLGEMLVKIVGLGILTYIGDSMNQFDAIVVIISLVELGLSSDGSEQGVTLTLFRGFRLLRVFRLARRWESFHKMMVKIAQTVKDILTFFVLLLIIVLVFSLLGVELFSKYVKVDKQGNIDPNGKSPRLNFDDPLNAIVSVFTCLIGDDWQYMMHDLIRAEHDRVMPCLYFLLVMIIGNLFLMNLFLAILLKNFEDKSEIEEMAHLAA